MQDYNSQSWLIVSGSIGDGVGSMYQAVIAELRNELLRVQRCRRGLKSEFRGSRVIVGGIHLKSQVQHLQG